VTFNTRGPLQLHSEVHLSYINVDADHDKGAVIVKDEADGRDGIMPVNMPIGMTESQAEGLATRLLWGDLANGDGVTFAQPPSMGWLAEDDIVSLPHNGDTYQVRLTEVTHGENGIVECRGVVEIGVDLTGASEISQVATTE